MEIDGCDENYSLSLEKAYIASTETIVIYKTLFELLTKRKEQRGNDEAFVWYTKSLNRITLTYNEWYQKSLTAASNLSSTIRKGDLVCVFCNNGINPVVALTALQILGAKTCIVAAERHLESICNVFNFKAIFLGKDFLTDNVRAVIKDVDKMFLLDGESNEGQINFEMLLEKEDSDFINNLPVVNPDDVTLLLLSSGSTGMPKLICKDQMAIVHMAVSMWKLTKTKNLFNDRTLAHLGGLFSVFSSAMGQTIVSTTVPMAKTSENILEICQNEKIEAAFFVLFFFYDLVAMKDKIGESLKDLKVITTGGQIPIKSVINKFRQIFPYIHIYDVYGSTEVSMAFSKNLTNVDDFFISTTQEISIRDENGRIVKRNENGEVWIRPHYGFHGYFGKESTAALSWQRMSDIGYITTKGRLEILGRTTDQLHIGMLKVNPFIYEEKINELNEIEKAVIIGIPDERLGETMCVVVKFTKEYLANTCLEKAEEFLMKWCSKNLKGNENLGLIVKVARIHVLKEEWPRTSLGKLIRKDVQRLVLEK
ncbi:DgyrCDS13349 [Dimorphilus gyrociliatus]|uniref:DgyrCDS13349 n=1 Tax=Dimorphilus gyrociliatus TaxID=2664684 RepID=A0A7I8WAG8_9ANNE|nr:DgyrCDS13349 [Dimorphilus gyrociliatus]